MSTSGGNSDTVKPVSRQPLQPAGSLAGDRTRIKVVLNIGRVELELLRTLKELRSIERLARFQVKSGFRDTWSCFGCSSNKAAFSSQMACSVPT